MASDTEQKCLGCGMRLPTPAHLVLVPHLIKTPHCRQSYIDAGHLVEPDEEGEGGLVPLIRQTLHVEQHGRRWLLLGVTEHGTVGRFGTFGAESLAEAALEEALSAPRNAAASSTAQGSGVGSRELGVPALNSPLSTPNFYFKRRKESMSTEPNRKFETAAAGGLAEALEVLSGAEDAELDREIQETQRRLKLLQLVQKSHSGKASQQRVAIKDAVFDYVAKNGPCKPPAIAAALNVNLVAVRTSLYHQRNQGLLQQLADGRWAVAEKRRGRKSSKTRSSQ